MRRVEVLPFGDMTEAAENLLQQAMTLSPADRLRVARQLLNSVVELEEGEEEWERSWLVELDRRLARMQSSDEPTLSWDQLQQRLRSLAAPR
jgi:putative addiction module component (TIGR02574 family)